MALVDYIGIFLHFRILMTDEYSGSYGMVKLVEISRAFYGIVEAAAP